MLLGCWLCPPDHPAELSAARADSVGNISRARPQRESAADNGRAQFKASLDRILIGLICRGFMFAAEASGWVLD